MFFLPDPDPGTEIGSRSRRVQSRKHGYSSLFRRGIHVGNLSYSDEALKVEQHLVADFMTSG